MEAVAKWDVETDSHDLLSFKKGDILKVMDKEEDDPQWYMAELNHTFGLVSENMIDMKPNPWYVGKSYCKSLEAETILLDNPRKLFLIRKSSNGLFLTFKRPNDDRVRHFKISKTDHGTFYFFSDQQGTREFFSLNELADFVKYRSWYSSPWWNPSLNEITSKPTPTRRMSYSRN